MTDLRIEKINSKVKQKIYTEFEKNRNGLFLNVADALFIVQILMELAVLEQVSPKDHATCYTSNIISYTCSINKKVTRAKDELRKGVIQANCFILKCCQLYRFRKLVIRPEIWYISIKST